MSRPSLNEQAFARFRKRLTEGFRAIDPDTGDVLKDEGHQRALDSTKPWRGELWKALNALEREVCPLTALKRSKVNGISNA
jgi:hypothetical protein